MLWIIDGYNVMHAQGVLAPKPMGAEKFRRARRRFLDHLAGTLGAERAHQTTVVFDASSPPGDLPVEGSYKGLSLIFALSDDDADTRIERLVARHSTPKSLTVVSSDRRIRQAATRRKARVLKADEYLDLLDRLPRKEARPAPARPTGPQPDREKVPSAEESAYWRRIFAHLEAEPETREAFSPGQVLLTDAEIARIQAEIDLED